MCRFNLDDAYNIKSGGDFDLPTVGNWVGLSELVSSAWVDSGIGSGGDSEDDEAAFKSNMTVYSTHTP